MRSLKLALLDFTLSLHCVSVKECNAAVMSQGTHTDHLLFLIWRSVKPARETLCGTGRHSFTALKTYFWVIYG